MGHRLTVIGLRAQAHNWGLKEDFIEEAMLEARLKDAHF